VGTYLVIFQGCLLLFTVIFCVFRAYAALHAHYLARIVNQTEKGRFARLVKQYGYYGYIYEEDANFEIIKIKRRIRAGHKISLVALVYLFINFIIVGGLIWSIRHAG
jgi:hypothetical protein